MSDVLLLLSGRNQSIVGDWLRTGAEHTVVATDPAAIGSADVDICILDAPTLLEHEAALRAWRADEHPVFLPFLLVIPEGRRHELVSADDEPTLPSPFDLVDDVVAVPVSRAVFAYRIESLVRIHEQSVELGNSERRYRALVEQSLSGVFVSVDGTFEFVNDRLADLVGMDPAGMLGHSTTELAASVDQDRLAADVRRFESGEVDAVRGTYEGERADGSPVHFVLEATRVDLVSGEAALGVVVDITEQVTAERQAASRAEQLSLLNRIVRHDIRNDLNVLLGWGETLQEHVDAEGRPALERVLRTGRHIQDLTYAVRDIAQLVEAEGEVVIEPTDAAAVLRREVEMVQAQYATSEYAVTVEGVADLPPRVVVRANEMLSSVFGNVLSNAVLHARSDAVTIRSASTSARIPRPSVSPTTARASPTPPKSASSAGANAAWRAAARGSDSTSSTDCSRSTAATSGSRTSTLTARDSSSPSRSPQAKTWTIAKSTRTPRTSQTLVTTGMTTSSGSSCRR